VVITLSNDSAPKKHSHGNRAVKKNLKKYRAIKILKTKIKGLKIQSNSNFVLLGIALV
jgi:hypothetical protein